VLYNFNFTIKK